MNYKTKTIRYLIWIVMAVLIVAVTGMYFRWSRPFEVVVPPPPKRPPKPAYIYLALIAPTSGPLAPLGQSMIRGAEMALESANQNLQIGQRPYKLLVEDEMTALEGGVQAVGDPKVRLVIGHVMERSLEASLPRYLEAKRPVLLPIISSPEAASLGQGLFYRLIPSDTDQARALAAFTKDHLNAASALSIHEDSDWGRSMSEAFVQAMNRNQPAEVEEVILPLEDPEAMEKLAAQVAAYKPKVIFLALHARSAVYAVQALSQNRAASPILGTHVLALTDVVPILERLSKNTYVTLPFNPDDPWEAEAKFIKRFSDLHRRFPNWVTAMTYNAVNLAVVAIDQSGDNPVKIRAFLDRLTGPPNTFKGLSGEYYFPTQGQGVGPIFIVPITPSLMGKIP